MESKDLNKLVLKYWEGESTQEEEAMLRKYAHLLDEESRQYFDGLSGWSSITPPVEINIVSNPEVRRLTVYRALIKYAAVGALLIFAFSFFLQKQQGRLDHHSESFSNPELALAQSEEALAFVLSKMQRGQKPVKSHIKKIETLNIIIPK